jgi:D-apionolactonase
MILKTKNLTCLYQNGNLRYVKLGDTEIVRMIYSAVRDELWLTATMTIFDEKIEQKDGAFAITYKAQYYLNNIHYQAFIRIEGSEDDTISFHFEGTAQSDFLRNRIGLCVHHPIRECAGQPVFIAVTEGGAFSSEFPK